MTAQSLRPGYGAKQKRVERLMQLMRSEGVYPKPVTTVRNKEHKSFCVLRHLELSSQSGTGNGYHLHPEAAKVHFSGTVN